MVARVCHDNLVHPFRMGEVLIALGNIRRCHTLGIVDQGDILDAELVDALVVPCSFGIGLGCRGEIILDDTVGFENLHHRQRCLDNVSGQLAGLELGENR